ncbi:MAG: hypothetical protein A3C43_06760 [Candidatus Schekmanbacteria bacterium RIFCSPHIGHO2_02_FULL_38_11]|uniref:Glycosyltransferase RgtA/B/C/D-like domain-containing protein n=1 Tax=Candidatus Schekmanbacteria bacterium RIFCSPLOWO2_12_FULL_38_15 TaxID=1817883 RepID=A0A1F7SNY0_9BACT|nr:MAG: hypothetical protein A2043_08350 [Candidatus Schekmanbacteria bacterium GWA2_38_9]OGL48461.1 MAG: hypothetical protein A3H37_07505 [Candidatus Schekmanbacteria bacterium RIFCSPLOWO2_02_FULL_38_14]OGL50189.1 MAG: hypothetical protein A3C43_06760 [Candidatus Schekmanbacteria bacterium RIFCSPHIGHO2_02_FULL_38_11]OGL54938.1 MAG: hypothetical protein A3G31_02335 [Candidatus Schekmanbacteria bacterium RIFCSPLOWO2_12_FULL_38_15]
MKTFQNNNFSKIIWNFIDYILLPVLIFFYTPTPFKNFIIPWDDGQFSAVVNELMRGKILYKDVWIPYPPLQIYPLFFTFKIFGATILIQKIYFYLLGGLGKILGYLTARSLLKNRFFVIFFSIILLSQFLFNHIRVSLGLIILLIIFKFLEKKKYFWIFSTGIFLGIAFLFSQETTLCALAGAFGSLLVFSLSDEFPKKVFLKSSLLMFSGIVIFPSLFFLYFYSVGALKPFFEVLIKYPIYVSSGFQGLPFPVIDISNSIFSVRELLSLITDTLFLFYLPIGIYILTLIYLVISGIQKKFNTEKIKILFVLIFGILAFRTALGRSDIHHLFFSISPAILISIYFMERLFIRAKDLLHIKSLKPVMKFEVVFMILLLIMFLVYFMKVFNLKNFFEEERLINYWITKTNVNEEGLATLNLKRGGGVRTLTEQANHFEKVISYISKKTDYNEPVFIFPQQAVYYFLADRVNPTRYCLGYLAITKKMREEAIRDLIQNGTKKIIYELDQEIDGISGEEYSPELSEYIFENYTIMDKIDNTLILRPFNVNERREPFKSLISTFLIRGYSLQRQGPLYIKLYYEEIEKFQKLVQNFPSNINYHNYFAILCTIGKNYEMARKEWEECLKLDPSFNPAKENLKQLEIFKK